MNGIYTTEKSSISTYGTAVSDGIKESDFEVGQQIQGIITKVSDKISMNFSGREVTVGRSTMTNAKEGEIRTFQITELSKSGMVLKEVGSTNSQNEASNRTMIFTKWDTQSTAILDKSNADESKYGEDKEAEEIRSRMTKEDYEALKKEGISLETYELERLARALERVKGQRKANQENIEQQVQKLTKETKELRTNATLQAVQSGLQEQIAQQLMACNLPVTEENIEKIESAITMAQSAMQLNDSAKYYLIRNELSPTADHLYKAVHSTTSGRVSQIKETFEEIAQAAEALIEQSMIEDTDQALKQAQWLFESDLFVTADNISYKMELDSLADNFSVEDALQEMSAALMQNIEPKDADLISGSKKSYDQFRSLLDSITDGQIASAVASQKNPEEAEKYLSLQQIHSMPSGELTGQAAEVSARRCVEEIRLKMTYEAALAMKEKGIVVETESLSRIVEELKAQEQTMYQQLAISVGDENTASPLILQQVNDTTALLQGASAYPLSLTFANRFETSLGSLGEISEATDAAFKAAQSSYETMMTVPRSDLGDSIQKAFQNVDEHLTRLGLETTAENQRAVRILGYNSIEITVDTIEAMKAYDAQVNDVLSGMTPAVTAELVKQGINPISLPFSELAKITKEVRESIGPTKEQKFSEFLVDLEENHQITQAERDSYVGIYRILHQVEASNGAVIGAMVKSNRELTLNNLLTEVRTAKASAVDRSVNDQTGAHENGGGYQNSILDQAGAAFAEKAYYQEYITTSFMESLTSETVQGLMEKFGEDLYTTPMDVLSDQLKQQESGPTRSVQNEYEQFMASFDGKEEVRTFLSEYGLSDSVAAVNAMEQYLTQSDFVYDAIRKAEDSKKNHDTAIDFTKIQQQMLSCCTSKDTMQSVQQQTFSEYETAVNDYFESERLTASTASQMTQAVHMISLFKGLAQKESYQIPVPYKETVRNVNLTVLRNSEEKGKVKITYPSAEHGNLYFEFNVQKDSIKCFMTGEDAQTVALWKDTQYAMELKLKELGFEQIQMNYSAMHREFDQFIYASGDIYKEAQTSKTDQQEMTKAAVDTDQLYLVAKAYIEQLTAMDL